MPNDFYQQIGLGISSLTFGVALSIFIYAAATGVVSGTTALLLFATSFLLMLRFWWRYNELFIRSLTSKTFWHFLFDFATSFFGILAVLYVGNIEKWAIYGALAMVSSIARCGLSWKEAKNTKDELKKTLYGAVAMLIIFAALYSLAAATSHTMLAAATFVIVLAFVVYSSRKA